MSNAQNKIKKTKLYCSSDTILLDLNITSYSQLELNTLC